MKVKIQSKNGHKVVDLNRRKAIRERYLNCKGWYPKEVSSCSQINCHLYLFRLGIGEQDSKLREKTIRRSCLNCMNKQPGEVSKCTIPDCPLFPYQNRELDRSVEIDSEAQNTHIEHGNLTIREGYTSKYPV